MGKTKKGIISVAFIVTLITFGARFFGLLREILVAKYYGASIYTDAYIIANNIPTVLFETLGTALLTSFIPIYLKAKKEKGEKTADLFTWKLTYVVLAICCILTIIAELFTKEIVLIFASGFTLEALKTTISFTRILFPSIFAMSLIKLYTGYLHVHDKYIQPATITIIGNLIIILSLLVARYHNDIYNFVYGSLFGIMIQVLFLIIPIIKLSLFKQLPSIKGNNEYIKQLLPLLLPVFIGSAIHEVNTIVDRSMVSGIEVGAVSTLNYGYKMISLSLTVVALPIINIVFPHLSAAYAENDNGTIRAESTKYINVLTFIMIPLGVFFILFRNEIVFILFQRGSFSQYAAEKTSIALAYYAAGLVTMALQQLEIRVFYSMRNTALPMKVSAVCTILNIVIDYLLIHTIGFLGAAIATSLVALISFISLSCLLIRQKVVCPSKFIYDLIKNLISCCVLIVVSFSLYSFFQRKDYSMFHFMHVFFICCISIVAYGLTEVVVKNTVVIQLLSRIIKRKKLE